MHLSGSRRAAFATVALTAAATGAVATAAPAVATQVCTQPPTADSAQPAVPWAQQAWDPADEVWPFSTGAGITVAVLDTGVQSSNPQLAGRVSPGADLVAGGTADVDCGPHGSGLAGVVVAGEVSGVGLRGLAPDAQVLPIQVVDQAVTSPGTTGADPVRIAAGLDAAVAAGAQVVLVGPVVYADDPELAAAVQRTLDAGVVVVAGVGDGHDTDRDGTGPTAAVDTPYPAAYPGVLGVAAVGPDGLRAGDSQIGDYVDLAAPGAGVVSTGTTAQQVYDGTAFAAAFVAAAAALVLADPDLVPAGTTDRPAAVQARLAATAVPPPAPSGYGAGLLSPGRAVTEGLSGVPPRADAGYRDPAADPAQEAAAAAADAATDRSLLWALGAGALALLAVLAGALVPRARRRRWRTGRTRPASAEPEPAGFIPASALFDPPR